MRDLAYDASGDLGEGFTAAGSGVQLDSTEVCVDVRSGKDASILNGEIRSRLGLHGRFQVERVSR